MTGALVKTAIRTADGTVEPLRTACLAAAEAVDRASRQVDGVEHELPRTGLATWDSALDLAWESLTMVYAGLAEARQLPGAEPTRIGDVLAGLKEARLDASRASPRSGPGTPPARHRRGLATPRRPRSRCAHRRATLGAGRQPTRPGRRPPGHRHPIP